MIQKLKLFIFLILILLGCDRYNNDLNVNKVNNNLYKPREVHNTNPKWGGNPKVALEFIRDIGEMDPKSEEFLYFKARDIALDSLGNIYILDRGNYRIKKLDKNGNYIETIGRQGQGPCEFSIPYSFDFCKDGIMYVAEFNNHIIHKIPKNKSDVTKIILKNCERIYKMIITKNNTFIVHTIVMNTPIPLGWGELTPLIKVYNQNGDLLREMVEPTPYKDFQTTNFGNRINFTIDKEDFIYVTFLSQNRIEKYSYEGKLLLKIDRKLNYEVVPEIRTGPSTFNKRASVVSSAIEVDNKGRIWVCTYTKQPKNPGTGAKENNEKYMEELDNATDMQEIEIFDNDGNLLGKIPLSINVSIMRIFGERIFFIGRQGLIIHEYKIIEK